MKEPEPETLSAALRLAAIVESSDDAIVSKDSNGTIVSWNAAAERMFGYTSDEAVGQSIRIIIPPDRQSEEDLVLARIRAGERVDHFETVRVRRNGERFHVSITVSPIRTADGRIIGASKIARDISDRKRTELALAEARAEQAELRRRLTTIIERSGSLLFSPRLDDVLPAIVDVAREVLPSDACAVWHKDGDTWRVAASQGLSDAFTSTTVAATPARDRLISESLVVESVDRDDQLGDRTEAFRREGIRALLAAPLQGGPGVDAAIAFYFRTPRVVSTVERESARGFAKLASAAIGTAQLYDAQRRSRFESEFIAETGAILVSSLDFREVLGRIARRVVPEYADWCAFDLAPDDGPIESAALAASDSIDRSAIEPFMRQSPEGEHGFSIDEVIRSGVSVLVTEWPRNSISVGPKRREAAAALGVTSVLSVPLLAHGRTVGALTLGLVDGPRRFGATELRFAQELAYRAALSIDNIQSYEQARAANRLKDDFLANLSHELRTPLNAIVGYARMLKSGAMPEDRRERAYDVLDRNASALTQIVEDVLDVSRIVSGKLRLTLQPVDLAAVVSQSVATVQPGADAKGVHIEVTADGAIATVAGDADRLQQVFWNLLSNAVKFTPRDGRIVVAIVMDDGWCEVSVADNGVGIDPKFLPHIFERFRQAESRLGREHGGLGLGLAIARQLVEMHGGTITATSGGHGQGSTFRVRLPSLSKAPPRVDPPSAHPDDVTAGASRR